MILVAVCLLLPDAPAEAREYETGPVTRKWGLGWDDGPTGRLWLKGVWELSLAGGPDDYRRDREDFYYTTGYPPAYEEQERAGSSGDRDEQGFVRAQVGRLLTRRGPLAAVAYLGVGYTWLNAQDYDDDDPNTYVIFAHAGGDLQSNLVWTPGSPDYSPNDIPTFFVTLGEAQALASIDSETGESGSLRECSVIPETTTQDGFKGSIAAALRENLLF